jgi:hypothetical protein
MIEAAFMEDSRKTIGAAMRMSVRRGQTKGRCEHEMMQDLE